MTEIKNIKRSNDLTKILTINKWNGIVAPYIYILATITLLFTCGHILKFNFQIQLHNISLYQVNKVVDGYSKSILKIDSNFEKEAIEFIYKLSPDQLKIRLLKKSNKSIIISLNISEIKIHETDKKVSLFTSDSLLTIPHNYKQFEEISICIRLTLWDYFSILKKNKSMSEIAY